MDLIEKNNLNIHRHPWEISRAYSIANILKNKSTDTQYADIGAGDLYFAEILKEFSSLPVYAVDSNFRDDNRIEGIISCNSVKDIPKKSIDCIFLMDVLEHVENETLFLESIMDILKPEGELIITVPAFRKLWSYHDIFLRHYRRYNKAQLVKLLKGFDLEVRETFYFYTSMFIIRYTQKILSRFFPCKKTGIGNWKFKKNNIITVSIVNFLNIDFLINRALQKSGFISRGLSLCAICQKKSA